MLSVSKQIRLSWTKVTSISMDSIDMNSHFRALLGMSAISDGIKRDRSSQKYVNFLFTFRMTHKVESS